MISNRYALLAATAIAGLGTAPAWAQADPQSQGAAGTTTSSNPQAQPARSPAAVEAGMSEDIIVTAQKRDQALVDIPQSVTVVGGETLERQQASTFQDYLKLVPGLQLNQDTQGSARLVLRGVNTGGVASTVAVYVDETPFGSSSGLANGGVLAGDFDTFDVARVEVLRGPQGTLYGASSLSGVLKFVTSEPDTTQVIARGRATVETVEGGDIGYSGNAVLNLPINDKIAIRGSGYYRKTGGFIDSIGTVATIPTGTPTVPGPTALIASDVEKNINDSQSYGGRASVLFRPSETFSVRLSAVLQNIAVDAPSVVESDPLTLKTLYGRLSQSQFVPQYFNTKYRIYNGTANLDLGFATLTSATSYGTLTQRFRGDVTVYLNQALAGALGTPDFAQSQETRQRKFTQELRLASEKSDRFEWLLGGYYTRETGRVTQAFDAYDRGTLTPVAGLPLLAAVQLNSKYKEYAGFANATVYFGDVFDLTFGGRYSHNKQSAGQINDGILAGGPGVLPTTRSSENVFTYSVAPKIKINDRSAVYARVAKGFRPGGPNVLPGGVNAPPSDVPRTFDSDSLVSYEVGIKAETDDRAFSIDVAAFHIDWKDIQLAAVVNGFGVNTNGGKARSDGVEFTATARPTKGLNLSLNGAYTRPRLRSDTGLLSGGFAGDRLPYTPKYSIGVNGDYEWTLVGETTAYVGGSLRSLSKQNGNYDYLFRTTYGRQRQVPAYEVVDVRAGVTLGRFSVEAYAKNLSNSKGRTSVASTFPTPSFYPAGALATGIIRPRTVGLSLTAGF